MRLVKSFVLAAFVTASAACFVLAFSVPGQAAARDLSQMEMARIFGGETVYGLCCQDDIMCHAVYPNSTPCPYRALSVCINANEPNYYEVLTGGMGKYCSRWTPYTGVACTMSTQTHVCLTRYACFGNYMTFTCQQWAVSTSSARNSCDDDDNLCNL